MRKLLLPLVVLACALPAAAQTNLQIFYDFGKDRRIVTTTLEGFYNDKWGNTFFFIDYDYAPKSDFPNGSYFEMARCLNFCQHSALAPFSLQLEYNGGVYSRYGINHAFLTGVDCFLHSGDFRNTFNLKLLYKNIVQVDQTVPMQFTFVWGSQDLFGARGLRFSGFLDVWEERGQAVVLSEPQLWYAFGAGHFHLGGEIELGYNFGGVSGFAVNPCLGMKWVF